MLKLLLVIAICFCKITLQHHRNPVKKPNIVVILADDLGYHDVGYRGNNQIKTPNIDALAYNGQILNRFYTLPMCTPSRAALLTGNYPIRSGMQGFPMRAGEERHLLWDMPTMPEKLREIGYRTHLVGKWHLGCAYRNATPTMRGFDTHYGYYNGYIGYFDHSIGEKDMSGLDFRDNFRAVKEEVGIYATDLFTSRSVKLIHDHDYKDAPLFLLVNHLAPHTGKTVGVDHTVLEEKNESTMNDTFGYVQDFNRRKYVDIVKSLDDCVGKIVKALRIKNVLDDTIILFFSDNGGQTVGLHRNEASNWPLRGLKMTNFEGGVRGTAVIFSSNMHRNGFINDQLMHITDLFPTFYKAAGGNVADLGELDGINQYSAMFYKTNTRRTDLLVNIDERYNYSSLIGYGGRYKLILGSFFVHDYNGYYGETGNDARSPPYDYDAVMASDVNRALKRYRFYPLTKYQMASIRGRASLRDCRQPVDSLDSSCSESCLFDLEVDPCETADISDKYPDVVETLKGKINDYYRVLIPQQNKPVDPRSAPANFGGSWSTWLDSNPI